MKTNYTQIKHNGKILEIKFSKSLGNKIYFENEISIILRWKNKIDDIAWAMNHPSKTFSNALEIINYLIENQESDYLKIKVYTSRDLK